MSFFRYPGGKKKLRKEIIPIISLLLDNCPNVDTYCEPFLGGGSITLEIIRNKQIKNICLNDN